MEWLIVKLTGFTPETLEQLTMFQREMLELGISTHVILNIVLLISIVKG
jgi:hypothetical protein